MLDGVRLIGPQTIAPPPIESLSVRRFALEAIGIALAFDRAMRP